MDTVKAELNYGGVYVSAPNVSVFCYDNDVMILYAHVTDHAHPVRATIHIRGDGAQLTELCVPGPESERNIELTKKTFRQDMRPVTELTADVVLSPGEFYEYRITR